MCTSTETALLDVLDGVYTAADDKQISVLIGLDLSPAFDTVDHSLLIDRLQSEFRVIDTPLDWLRSYLSGREQFVRRSSTRCRHTAVISAWPTVVRRILQPRC